jgi:hypothetical protein
MSGTEKFKASSDKCDAFMRKVGMKYPWLHPDYDPDSSLWIMRRVAAEDRDRKARVNRAKI